MPSLHDFPRRESHDRYRQTIRSHGGKEQREAFKSLDFCCRYYHSAATTIDFAVTTATLLPPITDSVSAEYDVSDSKTAKMTKKNHSKSEHAREQGRALGLEHGIIDEVRSSPYQTPLYPGSFSQFPAISILSSFFIQEFFHLFQYIIRKQSTRMSFRPFKCRNSFL